MDKKLIIYGNGVYKEIPLVGIYVSGLSVGTGQTAQLRFSQEKFQIDFQIGFISEKDEWNINGSDSVFFEKDKNTVFRQGSLSVGDDIKVLNADTKKEILSVYLGVHFEEIEEDYNKRIDCRQLNAFRIGGCVTSTIQILKPIVNDTEIVLSKEGNTYVAVWGNGHLGVSLNGYQVRKSEIKICDYDFFSINGCCFYFCEGWLYLSEKLPISTGLFTEVVYSSKNHMEYPVLIRSVRQMYEVPSEKLDVLPPKALNDGSNRSLVMTIIPVIVSMMFMVLMRLSMGRSIGFAIYSAGMMIVSIGMSIWNYKYQEKQQLEKRKNRVEKYNEYIENSEQKIRKIREKEQRIARQKAPSLMEQMTFVKDFDARLFERQPDDDDFLSCYVGVGTALAVNQVDYRKQEYVDVEDSLMNYPEMIHEKYKYTDNMPVLLDLKDKSAVGFIGERNKLYQVLKNTILGLSISHYFKDVKFCLFIDEEDISYFKWCRWLQNMDNELTGKRNIACNEISSGKLLEFLYTELSEREGQKRNVSSFMPHYVVFAYRSENLCKHPINKYFKNAKDLGVTFLFFEEYPEFLNINCEARIFLSSDNFSGYIQNAKNGEDIQYFSYPHITMETAEEAVQKMGCIYVEEANLESKLTKNITLFELLNISSVNQLNLLKRWNESKIYESMAAPLGVKSGDEVVYLDLHEKFHGPHGLVAGTTGSGKSEILQSYILSMATLFHPYEVGFIIIDFKGGGMVNQFRGLPHLNGAITNIDGKQIERSLMSIRAELIKRQELFASHEVNHIDEYIKLFKAGKAEKPLPHLILIVDEFAELKSEQPEFMKELISAARIGRSLGVHLILATQKPAGVVNDQIWSNSNFKLCLRVQTKEDSNEVLKSPLAAEIREPGRAYLQVGNNEIFVLFQSGYSGAVIPRENIDDVKNFTINMVDICGNRIPLYEQKRPQNDSDVTQLDVMVEYIADYCKEKEIAKLPDICLPPLSEHISYSLKNYKEYTTDVCVPLGYYDNPSRQSQDITGINLTQSNVMIVGSAQSGKTNLLQSIIRAITDLYTPESVNIYIMDFASMVLKRFESLAYVSGVITMRDDDTMKSFMKTIMEELELRKDRLSNMGYGSYSVYRESGKKEIPQIILMLDNMAAFRETFPQYEDAFFRLCREGVTVGISIIATNMQANAMGFRMLSNFGKRIALYSNDSSVYGQLFDRCKTKPDNVPGRFITQVDKEIYEGQCFVAFESEKESNKMKEIDKFVSDVNEKYKGSEAVKLEVLPEIVSKQYLKKKVLVANLPYTIPVGVDYLNIDVKTINIQENNIWGILEKEHSGTNNFIKYVIQSLVEKAEAEPVKIRIIDHITRKLEVLSEYSDVVKYSYNPGQVVEYINEIGEVLEARYQEMLAGNTRDEKRELQVLLINSPEAFNIIGGNYKLLDIYAKITSQYRGLGVFIILGKLPNASMDYGASPVIKNAKDGMNIFIFQNLGEQRVKDIPMSVMREYAKKLEIGDAYLIQGMNLTKLKTPLWEK